MTLRIYNIYLKLLKTNDTTYLQYLRKRADCSFYHSTFSRPDYQHAAPLARAALLRIEKVLTFNNFSSGSSLQKGRGAVYWIWILCKCRSSVSVVKKGYLNCSSRLLVDDYRVLWLICKSDWLNCCSLSAGRNWQSTLSLPWTVKLIWILL